MQILSLSDALLVIIGADEAMERRSAGGSNSEIGSARAPAHSGVRSHVFLGPGWTVLADGDRLFLRLLTAALCPSVFRRAECFPAGGEASRDPTMAGMLTSPGQRRL